jgi:hypothetical protein
MKRSGSVVLYEPEASRALAKLGDRRIAALFFRPQARFLRRQQNG